MDQIGFNKRLSDSRTYDVHTFLGSIRKSMKEACLSEVLAKCTREIPFLIDDDIDMEFDVPGLRAAVKNSSEKAVKLAADFSGVRSDTIHVHRCGTFTVFAAYYVDKVHGWTYVKDWRGNYSL